MVLANRFLKDWQGVRLQENMNLRVLPVDPDLEDEMTNGLDERSG